MAVFPADMPIDQQLRELTEDREPLDAPFSKTFTISTGELNCLLGNAALMQALSEFVTFVIEHDFKIAVEPFLTLKPPAQDNLVSSLILYLKIKEDGQSHFLVKVATMQKLYPEPLQLKANLPHFTVDTRKFNEIKSKISDVLRSDGFDFMSIGCVHSVYLRKGKADAEQVLHHPHALEFKDFSLAKFDLLDMVTKMGFVSSRLAAESNSREYKDFVRDAGVGRAARLESPEPMPDILGMGQV